MCGKSNSTRRSVLRKAGISIGALLSGSGVVSAEDRPSGPRNGSRGGIKVEDGKFVLDASPGAVGKETYRLSKAAVSNFNAVIEAGYFTIDSSSTEGQLTAQQAEQTSLSPSKEADMADIAAVDGVESPNPSVSLDQAQEQESVTSSGVSLQSCNETKVNISREWLPPKVKVNIYLSDGAITDISAAAGGGAPAGSVIYKYLIRKGYIAAGALAGPVATAIFAGVAAYWGYVNIKNNGCGVIIKTGASPVDPLVPTPTVSSQ